MPDEAVKFGATQRFEMKPPEKKIYGVTTATVLNNFDCTGEARVQLQLPWLPGYTPWARLSSPMAGSSTGSFFVPQVGDEVMVAFNQGDVREPYVLGACWSSADKPPASSPSDALTKRKIRTPVGHELEFDETAQTVTLTSNLKSTVKLGPKQVEISTPGASITLTMDGQVKITAKTKLTIDAPVIEITAKSSLKATSTGVAELKGSTSCSVSGGVVNIN